MSEATPPAATGSSFYAGMRVLPKAEREAIFAVYGFCRAVDDIADDQGRARDERYAGLEHWRGVLDGLYAGGGEPAGLAGAIRRFALDKADFLAIIDGMAMDVDADICAPSLATLDLYCDRVASAVGRLAVRIFGMEAAPGIALAHDLGRALQLTNILRDIDEDAAIGRVYLPREHLEAAGILPENPAQIVADPRLDSACRPVADMASAHFERANAILARRPAGRLLAPRLMGATYARLLRRMRAAGWAAPRRRQRVGKLTLIGTLVWLGITR
jgi:phytoene synthase